MSLPSLSVTDRYRLLELTIEPSQVVPPGRLMWLNGARIFAHASIDKLGHIPRGATGLMMSAEDFKEFARSPAGSAAGVARPRPDDASLRRKPPSGAGGAAAVSSAPAPASGRPLIFKSAGWSK